MLDFIKDIFSAFKQSSIERIKNPFVGAFVFSWLGFNWQILAIILFSEKDVIERIEYIKKHYDVGDFILAPLLTTVLICVLLPLANKVFTKYQSKPISETTDILMQSKIDIAEKQLQIADIEAKKKLAVKREERNIEEGIESIKKDIKNELEKNKEMTDEINELSASLKQSGIVNNNANLNLLSANEKITSLTDNLKKLEETIKVKTEEIDKMRAELAILNSTIENFKEANKSMAKEYEHVFSLHGDRLTIKSSALLSLKEINVEDIPF
ncbi:hypothetical protein [Serratia marcescens]|uniref:hypothetical protein n=1 Tax=Serratia TaxID=613 RepID=UPI0013DB300F|nr:hypothetical protein [Serratia marcescens]EIM8482249.1 hypothetical protein [Serratia marcescens]EIM8487987.1 hypothetical protein [Serratia marcescens]EIU9512358.1 hypothetical protein [Serratia marcescens]ELE6466007.1 hypothetical protein [Serratia marcescens]HBH7048785.1 hypothetical protein [Serratia marcescens]